MFIRHNVIYFNYLVQLYNILFINNLKIIIKTKNKCNNKLKTTNILPII